MNIREQLNSIAEQRIIVLDGAMGSTIQTLNLREDDFKGDEFANHPLSLEGCGNLQGCNDLLCLTRPGAIGAIHDAFLEAGADIIETCSFNSTSISLSDYGLGKLSYEISSAAAEVARKSADKYSSNVKRRFVAGSIGPTTKGASLYPDINNPGKRSISWDELENAYYDNARGLLDGGADIFLVETVFDTLNAKAALFAISRLLEERQVDVPIMVSVTLSSEADRLLSGQNLEAFCISVQHAKPWSIGINCSTNAQKLFPFVQVLSDIAPCFVSAYPNAGVPNKFGRYEEMPEEMSSNIESYLKEGIVNIIGGCCGSNPAHIAKIAQKVQDYKPRKIKTRHQHISFSGLEPYYTKSNAVSLEINDDFLQSINEGEYEDAADTARDMIDDGQPILNIKTDDEKALSAFLDYALMNPYVSKVPFMINSTDLNVLQTGLKRLQGRGLAGPVNLKDGEEEFIKKVKLIERYGAAAFTTQADEKDTAEIIVLEEHCPN